MAAFDVDKTLVVRDCVVPFMLRVAGVGAGLMIAGRTAGSSMTCLVRGRRDDLKRLFVREIFRSREVAEVEKLGCEFAEEVATTWMREDVVRRLRFHQSMGHTVVLVSASLDPYLHRLGEILEVDAVLCTTLERGADGRYTGEIEGMNCRGTSKVEALEAWRGEKLVGPDGWLTYAYGDSSGDTAMLAAASLGVNVRRTSLKISC